MVQVIQILVFRGILFQNIYMSIKGEKYYFKIIVRIMQYDILNIDYAIEFDFSCAISKNVNFSLLAHCVL